MAVSYGNSVFPPARSKGVTKEENNALVRLADALAGFISDAVKGKDEATQTLYRQVRKRGRLVEV